MEPHIIGLLFLISLPVSAQTTPPATQPATQPIDDPLVRKARAELEAKLSRLDADFRQKRAAALTQYVAQLNAAKTAAVRAHRLDEAQEIYETISLANIQIRSLAPPSKSIAPPNGSFEVNISQYNGSLQCKVTSAEISVSKYVDETHPAALVWRDSLTDEQQRTFASFLAAFPLDRLDTEYVDPDVRDGQQYDFEFKSGDKKAKRILVANKHQGDLERLIEQVNEFLPPKFLIETMAR